MRNELLRDGAGRDARHGLAGAAPATAAVVAPAELRVERVVGVPRPVHVLDVAVVARALVLVANDDRDGGAGRLAFEHTGEDLGRVGFFALRDDLALPGRRRSRSGMMSSSESGRPGGQPSMITTLAGPWLSPAVVTRKA